MAEENTSQLNVPEESVVEEVVVEKFPVVPMPLDDSLDPDFDYYDFNQNGRINFSPEYFEEIMKLYKGRKRIKNTGRGAKSTKAPEYFTPTQAFAIQAASEFNGRTGMGSYQELKNGTSKFRPGVKFTDKEILKYITTMEEKGFLESLGTRLIENVPSAAAFGAGFKTGKVAQSYLPPLNQRITTGNPAIDKVIAVGQTAYTAGRFALPYITGIGSSIYANGFGEGFGEFFLGEKTLPTPESYPTMRRGEVVADIAAFTPYAFFTDRAASNMLTDYFANRLAHNPAQFGRGFNFSGTSKEPFSKQWKNAQKIAQNKVNQAGKYVGTRGGKQFQGPLNINDLNERGVAAVLQGKTSPVLLRMLLTMENALKTAGKDAKKNKGLTLFYETLAAGGASALVGEAAKNNPFGASEMYGELLGGVAAPMVAGQATIGAYNKIKPILSELRRNISDRGLRGGFADTFRDASETARNNRGFVLVLNQLESAGSIDTPEQLAELIKNLESATTVGGIKQTAGQASKNPAIQAMEAALARDFESLGEAQKAARQQEIDFLTLALEKLAFGEGTEFEKDALRIAAQIEESIFEQGISGRLQGAENNLLQAFYKVQRSEAPAVNVDGTPLTEAQKQEFDSENMMGLSERLFNMLSAQKQFARAQQKTLYSKVGNVDVGSFFTDDGAVSTLPKFMRFLLDEDVIDESSVKKELASLYQFAQRHSNNMGLNQAIDLTTPKLDGYQEARIKLTGAGSLKLFDKFMTSLNTKFANDGLPEVVTDQMIDEARQGRNKRKGEKIKDTYNLYDSFMDALIEKKIRQGADVSSQAENAARQKSIDDFDSQASLLFDDLNTEETTNFNSFMETISDLTPSKKATKIREFVTSSSLRPNSHPGNVIAEKMEFLADNPFVSASSETTSRTGIPLSELRQIRSEALDIARNGQKSPSVQRAAGMFAAAVEDDLNNFANFAGDELSLPQIKALKTANAYTKAFSDVFYRSYVGDALAQTRDGNFRIAPETIAADFTKSRFDPNFLKIRDIEEVGKFIRAQNIPGAEGAVDSIHGVMDRIVRAARAEAIDPATGAVSQQKLNDWLQKNEQLGQVFPEVFADLKSFDVAQELFKQTVKNESASRSAINKQINFTSLLRNSAGEVRTNPASAVAEAMSAGKDQMVALDKLLDVIPKKGAKKNPIVYEVTDPVTNLVHKFFDEAQALNATQTMPGSQMSQVELSVDRDQAIAGFKSSLFEYFVFGAPSGKNANKNRAVDDPLGLYRDLFEKKLIVGGQTGTRRGDRRRYATMTEYLKSKGVFTDQDIGGLKKTLEALIVAKSGDAAGMLGENFEEAKPILDFALAITGSAIGTKSQSFLMGGSGGPGSIIAAGKGAEAMRNIFLRMPQGQRMLFTAELMQDPKLMAKMLREYGTGDQKKGVVASVQDWLKTNFYSTLPRRIFAIGETDETPETKPNQFTPPTFKDPSPVVVPKIPVRPDNTQQGSLMPTGAPTPDVGSAPLSIQQASAAPGPSIQNSGPVDRERFAALFPNDSTTQLMKSGIGSLA